MPLIFSSSYTLNNFFIVPNFTLDLIILTFCIIFIILVIFIIYFIILMFQKFLFYLLQIIHGKTYIAQPSHLFKDGSTGPVSLLSGPFQDNYLRVFCEHLIIHSKQKEEWQVKYHFASQEWNCACKWMTGILQMGKQQAAVKNYFDYTLGFYFYYRQTLIINRSKDIKTLTTFILYYVCLYFCQHVSLSVLVILSLRTDMTFIVSIICWQLGGKWWE